LQGRLDAAVAEACRRHITTWDVLDVCNWIESIGFLNYRKKFAHNRWGKGPDKLLKSCK